MAKIIEATLKNTENILLDGTPTASFFDDKGIEVLYYILLNTVDNIHLSSSAEDRILLLLYIYLFFPIAHVLSLFHIYVIYI